MDKITVTEKKKAASKEAKMQEIDSLENEIENAKTSQNDEEDNREILFHILDRMRSTIVSLKSKSNEYRFSLHKKSFALITEKQSFNKSRESRARTANVLVRLKSVIKNQTNEEKREVVELEKNVEKRKIASMNRAEARKKQEEIIEKAMIDTQSSKLEVLREKYFMNKLWYSLSTKRFEWEKTTLIKYEEAYLKIKLATGISEVPLFVQKFLTREKNFREMLSSVKNKETELNHYKEKIAFMQEEVEKFNSKAVALHKVETINPKLHKLHKNLQEVLLKKKNIVQVHDKISKWIQKIKNKLQLNYPESFFSTQPSPTNNTFSGSIHEIKIAVSSILSTLDREKFLEVSNNKGSLRNIIDDIPESYRRPKRFTSSVEYNQLDWLESEPVIEEINKKTKKN